MNCGNAGLRSGPIAAFVCGLCRCDVQLHFWRGEGQVTEHLHVQHRLTQRNTSGFTVIRWTKTRLQRDHHFLSVSIVGSSRLLTRSPLQLSE